MTAEMWESRPAITVVPGCFRLVYAENRGAAFSMLDGHVSLLGLFSVVAVIGLFFYWRALPPKPVWGRAAIALIVSGAAGNMFDRLARGYVVDFFDAYIGTHHWPTFNVADSCICVGAGIMIVLFLMRKV